MVNHIIKYSLTRIFIGLLVIIILSSFAYESTRSKYGSYADFSNNSDYSFDNDLIERVYFGFDLITTSIPFALLDFISFGILSEILQPRDEFGISFHYNEPAMEIINYFGPITVMLLIAALVLVFIATSIWLLFSRKLNRNRENKEIVERINYQKEYILISVIIFIPILWVFIMENFFYSYSSDFIFNLVFMVLNLPLILSYRDAFTNFEPLLDIDLLGFDIIIMNLDWFIDRIVHLILPSIFLFLGFLGLVLIFIRKLRVTEKNLPDTSFHISSKSNQIYLKIPAILFIGFTFFVVLMFSDIVQIFFAWPGIVRSLNSSEFTSDWALIVANKIALYRIIVWLSILVDITYYIFSYYRIKNKNVSKNQESIA